MTAGEVPGGELDRSAPDDAAVEEARLRRRLALVFGEVLPEGTSDDRDGGEAPGDSDDWLRRNVPPHHG